MNRLTTEGTSSWLLVILLIETSGTHEIQYIQVNTFWSYKYINKNLAAESRKQKSSENSKAKCWFFPTPKSTSGMEKAGGGNWKIEREMRPSVGFPWSGVFPWNAKGERRIMKKWISKGIVLLVSNSRSLQWNAKCRRWNVVIWFCHILRFWFLRSRSEGGNQNAEGAMWLNGSIVF